MHVPCTRVVVDVIAVCNDGTVAMCITTCVALCTLYGVLHVYNTDYCWCVGLFLYLHLSHLPRCVRAFVFFARVLSFFLVYFVVLLMDCCGISIADFVVDCIALCI